MKMLGVSAGSALVLGLARGRVDCAPTTLYLLLGEGCTSSCAFCPQSRDANCPSGLLSRVTWPNFDTRIVIEGIHTAYLKAKVRRVCLQTKSSPGVWDDVIEVIRLIRQSSGIPISVSTQPDVSRVREALDAGAERVGLPLDAANPGLYRQVKGGSWERRWRSLEEAARLFPGRISTHLIMGLGETEEDMIRLIQRLHDLRITVGLFAFTPVKGTRLELHPKPDLSRYRLVQAAHYLISRGASRVEDMAFLQNRIVHLGMNAKRLEAFLAGGEAFKTSGCPDCNRPYYNEGPRGPLYNYPRPLDRREAEEALLGILEDVEVRGECAGDC